MLKLVKLPPKGTTCSFHDMLTEYPPPGWDVVLKNHKKELDHLDATLPEGYYPYKWEVFNALYYTPFNNVKVVIIGQDPYHSTSRTASGEQVPVACGLSFSVRDSLNKITPSIKNIYRRLEDTIPEFEAPDHGDLTKWAYQGVLMLNMCLTVTPGKAGSHGKRWLTIIKPLITYLVSKKPKTIFLLWGTKARIVKSMIGNCPYLEASHPSPLSINAFTPGIVSFEKCDHFNEVNKYLQKQNIPPIDWQN